MAEGEGSRRTSRKRDLTKFMHFLDVEKESDESDNVSDEESEISEEEEYLEACRTIGSESEEESEEEIEQLSPNPRPQVFRGRGAQRPRAGARSPSTRGLLGNTAQAGARRYPSTRATRTTVARSRNRPRARRSLYGRAARQRLHSPSDWTKNYRPQIIRPFGGTREVKSRAVTEDCTPLTCFLQFFTIQLFDHILEMSNKYMMEAFEARQSTSSASPRSPPELITMEHLKAYFGLLILMSIVRLPRLDSYWQTKHEFINYKVPNTILTRDRFRQIHKHLHFCDEKDAPAGTNPDRDRLYKIRPLLDHLLPAFKNVYSLGPEIAIDETLIPFKGRIYFKQFIPSKRARFGIKVWVLAESETGYVGNLQVYSGKLNGVQSELGLSARVVNTLMEDYNGLWHRLYLDNFYTSPALFEALLQKGIYACGTARKNRKGFPKELIINKLSEKPRGYYDWLVNSKNVVAHVWVDNRIVYFCSTFHAPDYHLIPNYTGSKTVPRRGSNDVPCPPLLPDYNHNMGGVDLCDQMRKFYSMTRRCRSWYRRVFTYLFEVAILNSRVVYQKKRKEYDTLLFRLEIAKGLIGQTRTSRMPPNLRKPDQCLTEGNHFPRAVATSRRCSMCSFKKERSETNIRCLACEVYLCVKQGKTCWEDWHLGKAS